MFYAPTSLPPNPFKAALRNGQRRVGLWGGLCSNIAADVIAGAGFDWIVIDTEHAPNEIPGLLSQLQAMSNGTAEVVVRCAWNDAVLMKRILDVGARSLLVPKKNSATYMSEIIDISDRHQLSARYLQLNLIYKSTP